MKITLVMVSSVNGKITKGDDPEVRHWTSPEDQALFDDLREHASCIIMGRKTYDTAKNRIRLTPRTRRIVMTSDPTKYFQESVKDQLEFTNEPPKALVTRLEKEGYKEALLMGGGETNTAFFNADLVQEIRLTVEPLLFGAGQEFVTKLAKDIRLRLVSHEIINDRGTMHLVYSILPNNYPMSHIRTKSKR